MREPTESLALRRQEPLRARYRVESRTAWIEDHARALIGAGTDPFHGEIEPANNGGVRWAYGIHRAVGGDHDAPNPGDLLSAALAACLHSTARIVADRLGLELLDIEVAVAAQVDVRGTLMVDTTVPVGFQHMRCDVRVHVPAGADPRRLKALMSGAEHCCVVLQTLKGGVDVRTDWRIDQEIDEAPARNVPSTAGATTGTEVQP